MSEYQYYEFAAIDRPITAAEMAQLRKMSKRGQAEFIEVDPGLLAAAEARIERIANDASDEAAAIDSWLGGHGMRWRPC